MINNKTVKNATWIIACKIAQSVLALIINMLTARYLGPSNYGLINYAASLVAFVTPIMQLGLNSILVQEIVHEPHREGKILGTSIVLSVLSAMVCMFGIFSFASIANAGEIETISVCTLYSILLVFQAVDLIQYWFQAKLMSKYTSLVMLAAYMVVSAYKAYLLATDKSIYWFAVSNAIDYLIIAACLIVFYKKLGGQSLSFSWTTAKALLSKSRYFIVSSLMITVFSQTDKIMLKHMVNEDATGYYSAAVACALLTNFVFTAVIDSLRPTIFEKKKNRSDDYENSVMLLFSIMTWLSILQCVVLTLLSDFVIYILYGNAFSEASALLRVVVWYTAFSYIGAARSVWILAEEQQKYIWILNLFGAVFNVVLNYALIPFMGAMGAALASLITQSITNIVIVQVIPAFRYSNRLLLKSINPKFILSYFRLLRGK